MTVKPKRRAGAPLDDYVAAQPLLAHVRIMQRFFDEVVDAEPGTRHFYADLHVAYMNILNEELAPHALTFALAITQLEDAYPAVRHSAKRPK